MCILGMNVYNGNTMVTFLNGNYYFLIIFVSYKLFSLFILYSDLCYHTHTTVVVITTVTNAILTNLF